MKVEIIRYSEDYRQAWESLVGESINGTFLHTRAFFDHNKLNAEDDCSFLFFKKGKPIALIPASCYRKNDQTIFNSHLRSTFGGFVVTVEVRVEEAIEMVELLVGKARELGVNEIIIRNPFRIFANTLCDETDYAMWYHGFSIKHREVEIAIELGDPTKTESYYDDGTRRSIKKGKKALVVEESTDYERYWQILERNLEAKHGIKPIHNYSQFCMLLQHVGAEKIKLFAAKLNNEIIGGIVLFISNNMTVHAQYVASDAQYQDYRPLNVVTDFIISWASQRGFKYFNLGNANENSGKMVNLGLFRFKEGFGGRGVLRETMHLMIEKNGE